MSSIYASGRFTPSLCIDGDFTSAVNMCHSASDSESPWLSIELSARGLVDTVRIYNRVVNPDRSNRIALLSRLSPFEVWVGDAPGDPTSTGATRSTASSDSPHPSAASTEASGTTRARLSSWLRMRRTRGRSSSARRVCMHPRAATPSGCATARAARAFPTLLEPVIESLEPRCTDCVAKC